MQHAAVNLLKTSWHPRIAGIHTAVTLQLEVCFAVPVEDVHISAALGS